MVPGLRDPTDYAVWKDAPTASRILQHLLLAFIASFGWELWSADVKSAFLKGELFGPHERELYIGWIKTVMGDEPQLPLGQGGLARLKKGIFGLSDSPRRWYLRLHKSLTRLSTFRRGSNRWIKSIVMCTTVLLNEMKYMRDGNSPVFEAELVVMDEAQQYGAISEVVTALGWERSALNAAMWWLWNSNRTVLLGLIISHVDDLLMGGNKEAKKSLDKLGEELTFGSIESGKFTYCG